MQEKSPGSHRTGGSTPARSCAAGRVVTVCAEMVCDTETPISVYQKLRDSAPAFILESVEGGESLGRYSFLGFDPFITVRSWGSTVEVEEGGCRRTVSGNPLVVVKGIIERLRVDESDGLPRFFGGAVGYMSYDLVRFYERLPGRPPDECRLPDCYLVFPSVVVVFDHVTRAMTVVVNALADDRSSGAARMAAMKRASSLLDRVRDSRAPTPPRSGCGRRPLVRPGIPPHRFLEMVARAKEYIAEGEVFQVVLSQRLAVETRASPFAVYRALRRVNPSPYMFFLDFEGVKLVGSSPEMLVRLERDVVETRPIAGTRPRGKTPEEDSALAAELLSNEKERAEHVMLVDLGRNDLGRVCRFGTVEVPQFMTVERYSHVMHIVSSVRGRLAPGRDAFDALAACFPAGTVSGAPKVRAMEIIDELEPTGRGPYAGAVGYFGLSGNMDTCITIRTIVFDESGAWVQAGAGIVADSDPEREHRECMNKARAVLKAVELAEGVLP